MGQVLKKRLLNKFKNIKSISEASIEDLMTLNGINEKIAQEIKTILKLMTYFINHLTLSRIFLAGVIFLLLTRPEGYLSSFYFIFCSRSN